MQSTLPPMRVGVLGGTGPAGRGVGLRLALAGHDVLLGSRDPSKAQASAESLGHPDVRWGDNYHAAAFGEVTVLAVPWEAALPTAAEVAAELHGKILLSMANAVAFIQGKPESVVPSSGSLALGIQARMPGVQVVAALHHVPARSLCEIECTLDFDVLCAGDHADSLGRVMDLVGSVPGLRPIDAGALVNASAIESLTPLLIGLNSRYKARTGIRIQGIPLQRGSKLPP